MNGITIYYGLKSILAEGVLLLCPGPCSSFRLDRPQTSVSTHRSAPKVSSSICNYINIYDLVSNIQILFSTLSHRSLHNDTFYAVLSQHIIRKFCTICILVASLVIGYWSSDLNSVKLLIDIIMPFSLCFNKSLS